MLTKTRIILGTVVVAVLGVAFGLTLAVNVYFNLRGEAAYDALANGTTTLEPIETFHRMVQGAQHQLLWLPPLGVLICIPLIIWACLSPNETDKAPPA